MVSIHINIGMRSGKWHTRHYTPSATPTVTAIVDFDDIITNFRNARGWKVKVGYNLLRECV